MLSCGICVLQGTRRYCITQNQIKTNVLSWVMRHGIFHEMGKAAADGFVTSISASSALRPAARSSTESLARRLRGAPPSPAPSSPAPPPPSASSAAAAASSAASSSGLERSRCLEWTRTSNEVAWGALWMQSEQRLRARGRGRGCIYVWTRRDGEGARARARARARGEGEGGGEEAEQQAWRCHRGGVLAP